MKLIKNKKYIIVVIFVIGIFVLFNSNVFGEVNSNYSGTDTVPDEYLEESLEDSVILKLFAKLVYGAGRLIEWLLGIIFKLLTGISDYPWADKIVFNAVPLLDVNFINPADGSFVGGNSGIKDLLKNLYGTCFTIAVTFFGIAVMVMAIKLVISTIASDKAKYKQAIIDWFIGLLLLFCMNYFISFIFYLNEQLVEVASGMVTTKLSKINSAIVNSVEIKTDEFTNEYLELVKENNLEANLGNSSSKKIDAYEVMSSNPRILSTWRVLPSGDASYGLHEGILKEKGVFHDEVKEDPYTIESVAVIIDWAVNSDVTVKQLQDIKKNLRFLGTEIGRSTTLSYCITSDDFYTIFGEYENFFKNRFNHSSTSFTFVEADSLNGIIGRGMYKIYEIRNGQYKVDTSYDVKDGLFLSAGKDAMVAYGFDHSGEYSYSWPRVLDDLIALKSVAARGSGNVDGAGALISDLATYFRYNSYDVKTDENDKSATVADTNKMHIQNMLMYAILVVQSLILFVSYIKRLFYVILLAMIAPIVVVYDFFQKVIK